MQESKTNQRQNPIDQLDVLRRITNSVDNKFNLDHILQTAVDEIGSALKVSRCFLYQVDSSGHLVLTHEFVQPEVAPLGVDNPIVFPGVYWSYQNSASMRVDDVLADPRMQDPSSLRLTQETSALSLISVPLFFQGTASGILAIHQCGQTRQWLDADCELVETAAMLLSTIMQSFRVFKQQEKLTDSLASMNQDLSRVYVELAAKDQQIDRFMHLISHDLRAPVVAIHGLVDLLQKQYVDEPPDSKPRRYLELINRSAEQINTLTTMLLEFARLGQSSLRIVEVDTDELVKELWQKLTLQTTDAQLEIFAPLPTIMADRPKMTQVFQNLLENAIKYRQPDGRLVVDITCEQSADSWQFAINDNGIGFHPSEAEQLFDLFARLKEAQHRPGSGIGLASVMEIARLHGGSASAVGRPGKGSTFFFTVKRNLSAVAPN